MTKFYNIDEQKYWNNSSIWIDGGHCWSAPFGSTEGLWNNYIFSDIKHFRNKNILEIAPGHGRLTQFLAILASELVVVDLNENCIIETRKKLGDHIKKYIINDGLSLPNVEDGSQDLVFSFDSFVHMHANVVQEYIKEISRVLVKDGCGYIHHSWFGNGSENSFDNVAGRANMSMELFRDMVEKENMEIIFQKEIQFFQTVDCISFFKKC